MDKVTETAFIQSISENQYIREYCRIKGTPVSFEQIQYDYENLNIKIKDSNDMKLFQSFMNTNTDAKDFIIQDYSSFGEDKGHSVLVSHNDDVYVAFNGTNDREWVDNGIGMYSLSTDQQRAAANRFDEYMRAYGYSEDNNITVTGHSKGGNKAMFVTMEAEKADLITNCIAFDGQGFSPEAKQHWEAQYGDLYKDVVNKITLISGENDYVHQLGICIAGHQYTIGYQNWTNIDEKDIFAMLGSYHGHEWLFGKDGGNLKLNSISSPGELNQLIAQFMDEYMQLSKADREKSAVKLMRIIQLFKTGEINSYDPYQLIKDIDEILVFLSETPTGRNLLNYASGILMSLSIQLQSALLLNGPTSATVVAPAMALVTAINNYIELIKLRGWIKSWSQNDKPKISTNINHNTNHNITIGSSVSSIPVKTNNNSGKTSAGSCTEIALNKEAFEGLIPRFESNFDDAIKGARLANESEAVELGFDSLASAASSAVFDFEAQSILLFVNTIVQSFTSADEESKREAEKIIGPEIYSSICSGYTVVYDSNGGYSVQAVHQESLENYQGLQQHLPDNCTNTSLAMMIQRYYLMHYGQCDLVYDDINKNDFYWAVEYREGDMSKDLPGGHHYETHAEGPGKLIDAGGGNIQQGLANQLLQHPEGVVIYGRYATGGRHAILVTNCDVNSDGSFTFYAIDPATGNETDLQHTTLFSSSNWGTYGSVDSLLNNLFDYQYLSSVW